MKHYSKYLVLSALVGGLTACGSDGPSEPSNQLSEQEIQEVMAAAFEAASVAFGVSLRPLGPGLDGIAAADPVNETGQCPLGGEVEVTGEVNDSTNEEGTGDVNIDLSINWIDCVVQTSKRRLTLDGEYLVDAAFTYDQWEPVGDARLEIEGQFTWSGSGKSGTCPFNVVYLVDMNEQSITVTGSTCGRNINFSSDDWSN